MPESDRDPRVAERYREIALEEPPRALDAAIVSAARDALEVRPAPLVAPTARRRWFVPLAAAAVIVLSVAVTLRLQREQPDLEIAFPQEATPRTNAAPAAPAPAAPPRTDAARGFVKEPAVAAAAAKAPPAATDGAREDESKPQQAARPAPAAAPSANRAAPPPQAIESRPVAESNVARRAIAEGAARAVPEELPPETWLKRIVELRREGRHAEADEAYAAFRRRYPDFRIPEALRDQVLPR